MITQTQTTIFKQNVLSGLENFTATSPYTYKIALYTANADLNQTTAAYTSVEEIVGTGYTAGGQALTIIPVSSDSRLGVAYVSFQDVTWNPATFVCRGALIYNSTTGASVAVLDFGNDKSASNTFTITFPTDDAGNAIIRFA